MSLGSESNYGTPRGAVPVLGQLHSSIPPYWFWPTDFLGQASWINDLKQQPYNQHRPIHSSYRETLPFALQVDPQ